eukprot:COSAG01_NODE_42887_length_435_cov_1.535714_1_plen_38_part_01
MPYQFGWRTDANLAMIVGSFGPARHHAISHRFLGVKCG